ncbi:MAG: prolipoprotein diacylglyceryl transferase [Bacteroidetes bacterium]|nr:prolipoprotein diacylglyceryl transferase [Bacteroidota bacterium]
MQSPTNNQNQGLVDKLKSRWNVKNTYQVILILLVFICTGTTVMLIKKPLFATAFPDGDIPSWAKIIYWVVILPVYNFLLLCYGFIFGQFRFFLEFEKKFFKRIFSRGKAEANSKS